MDHEFDKTLAELDNKACHIFRDFMTRVVKIEELTSIGNQLLRDFHQELEFFRRPPLQKMCKVVQDVIEANQTCRLKTYIEAGCRHAYMDKQNIRKLNMFLQCLQDHLIKVGSLLDELKCLSEDGIVVMRKVNQSTLHLFDKCSNDCCINQASSFAEVGQEIEIVHPPGEIILLRAILMRALCNMLKLDYEMQSKVVLSLNLNSSSEELESYCLMWDLRPFINENMIKQCWRFVSQ